MSYEPLPHTPDPETVARVKALLDAYKGSGQEAEALACLVEMQQAQAAIATSTAPDDRPGFIEHARITAIQQDPEAYRVFATDFQLTGYGIGPVQRAGGVREECVILQGVIAIPAAMLKISRLSTDGSGRPPNPVEGSPLLFSVRVPLRVDRLTDVGKRQFGLVDVSTVRHAARGVLGLVTPPSDEV